MLLAASTGLPLAVTLACGAALGGAIGLAIGWLTLRLHGPYLGLTTIAFAEILRIGVTAEHGLTGGSRGLQAPALIEGASRVAHYYALLAALAVSLALMGLVLRSRVGLFLQAIREDEDGAREPGRGRDPPGRSWRPGSRAPLRGLRAGSTPTPWASSRPP